jgi:hypothetical protein
VPCKVVSVYSRVPHQALALLRTELENTDTVSTMAMTVAAMASPRITSSLPFVPHIFSMAGSNTGAEREVSQGRILCAA